jgi:hypothetical protein
VCCSDGRSPLIAGSSGSSVIVASPATRSSAGILKAAKIVVTEAAVVVASIAARLGWAIVALVAIWGFINNGEGKDERILTALATIALRTARIQLTWLALFIAVARDVAHIAAIVAGTTTSALTRSTLFGTLAGAMTWQLAVVANLFLCAVFREVAHLLAATAFNVSATAATSLALLCAVTSHVARLVAVEAIVAASASVSAVTRKVAG